MISGEKRLLPTANSEERPFFRYDVGVDAVTAFVLAGGRSSRMGSDKALLAWHGETLLTRALRTASTVAGKTYISGARNRYQAFGEVVEDIYPDCGPLGGIHAALSASSTDLNLILSVDMPAMISDFLRWLLAQASRAPELIVVPYAAGGQQPLCAVYRRAVREIAEQALQKGEYKIGRLFSQVPTRIITEEEIVSSGFSPHIFRNINTPAEYDNCLR